MTIPERQGFIHLVIPRYDEVVLFAMSLTCVTLLISGTLFDFRDAHFAAPDEYDPRMIATGCIFFSGLFLSLRRAFAHSPMAQLEKSFMLFFAVIMNAFSGFMINAYELAGLSGWLVVFPIVNMISSFRLLVLWRGGVLNESSITDTRAPRGRFLLAAAIVLLLYFLCHSVFNLMWVQTLSICLVYSTNLTRLTETWVFQALQ